MLVGEWQQLLWEVVIVNHFPLPVGTTPLIEEGELLLEEAGNQAGVDQADQVDHQEGLPLHPDPCQEEASILLEAQEVGLPREAETHPNPSQTNEIVEGENMSGKICDGMTN